MAWWLWMIAGAATAAFAFIIFKYIVNLIDDRPRACRRIVRAHQADAEQQVLRIMQDTIQEMFNTTRG